MHIGTRLKETYIADAAIFDFDAAQKAWLAVAVRRCWRCSAGHGRRLLAAIWPA
jgi:hypothetical protein